MNSDINFQKQTLKPCTGDTSQIMQKLSWEKLKERYSVMFNGSVQTYNGFIKSRLVAGKECLADDNSCDVCKYNMRARAIPLKANFPSGHLFPPAGKLCRCTLLPVVIGDEG